MTLREFVGLEPSKIRRDKELMQLYINFYEAAFSLIPNCVGCSFKGGFKKLKQYALHGEKNINFDKNIIEMKATKTFLLKKEFQLKILTYIKDGKTHRSYGYNLTEEFANELVNSGKSNVFSTLPKTSKKVKDIEVVLTKEDNVKEKTYKVFVDYDSLSYRKELIPLYTQAKERTGKEAKSQSKSDVIKFLQDNES